MLVSAFIGYENMKYIYETAVKKYRFLSYGDAMLLEKMKFNIKKTSILPVPQRYNLKEGPFKRQLLCPSAPMGL